jgi:hypothetical protein
LALAAWRYPGEDGVPLGYRELPPLNIAACGLAPNASEQDWLRVAERAAAGGLPVKRDLCGAEQNLLSSRVRAGLEELYRLFQQGPTLGRRARVSRIARRWARTAWKGWPTATVWCRSPPSAANRPPPNVCWNCSPRRFNSHGWNTD